MNINAQLLKVRIQPGGNAVCALAKHKTLLEQKLADFLNRLTAKFRHGLDRAATVSPTIINPVSKRALFPPGRQIRPPGLDNI